MATLETIQARIAKLQAQAASVAAKKSSGVLEKIRDLMEKHGLVIADIETHFGKKRGRKASVQSTNVLGAVAAKYRDPKTGATWSGRGRAPAWIANAKDRTKFAIADMSSTSVTTVKATAKAGNYVRGPQPALYRDPKTGATWSGRGRAPAWIASVKDRTKFLISETGDSTTSSTSSGKASAKKVAAKKAATKNTATKSAPTAKKAVRAGAASKKVTAKKAVSTKAAAKKISAKKGTTKNARAKTAETDIAAPTAVVEHIDGAAAAPTGE
ncbi:H-NS family nucleoid-associated regulatory protein [Paraburkholderia pallida]|uniref:Histone n=1 Tax=Paraburkholderia pallida TaxID=2547399 RepID=A0A4P7D727_9BURK|nr:H-NS family nucleoid-associated regulatory protein [Paraburkholderia pallida]QBR02504.1 histone [Paraburkholderia pallida]